MFNNEDIFKFTTLANTGILSLLILNKIFKKINKTKLNNEFKINSLKEEIEPLKLKKKSFSMNDPQDIYIEEFDNKRLPIYKFCLTGGPCAGKTTSLALLSKKFTELGFNVIIVPEIATLTVEAGGCVILHDKPKNYAIDRQSEIIKTIIKMEDYYYNLAITKNNKPTILLCDRGCLDGKAYVDEKLWQGILDEKNWDDIKLSHNRYDAIIHLVTAADGKKKYYQIANNLARSEGIDLAIELDRKIQNCYKGHPKHIIIKNLPNQNFEDKINWVFEEVSGLINLKVDYKFSGNINKSIYLLKNKINLSYEITKVNIEKIILNPIQTFEGEKLIENKERILTKHTIKNASSYYLNTEIKKENETIKFSRKIKPKDFILYKKEQSKFHIVINYEREIFIIDKKVYMQDEIFCKDNENFKKIFLLKRLNMKNFCCDGIEHLPEELIESIVKVIDNKERFIYNIRSISKIES